MTGDAAYHRAWRKRNLETARRHVREYYQRNRKVLLTKKRAKARQCAK